MARVLVDGSAYSCRVYWVVGFGILLSVSGCDIARITGKAPSEASLPRYSLMSFDLEPSAPEVVSVTVTKPETPAVAKADFKSVVSDELLSGTDEILPGEPTKIAYPSVVPPRVGGVTQAVTLTRSGIDERNAHIESLLASLPRAYNRSDWVTPMTAPERVQKAKSADTAEKLVARPFREPMFPTIYVVYLGVCLGIFGAFLGLLAIRLHYSND